VQQQTALQTFEITDPKTGMVIEMTGTTVPTEAEIRAAFDAVQKPALSHPLARVGEAVKGGIKGAVTHGLEALKMGGAAIPGVGMRTVTMPSIPEMAPGLLPSNRPQEVGMSIEEALEYLVPASRVTRGANAAANAVRNATVRAGRNRALQTVTRGAVEGGAAATIASAQGDSPMTEGATSAALTTLVPAAANARNLSRSATRDVYQALQPTTKGMKRDTARIAADVARRGVRGSREDVEHLAEAQTAKVGNQIGDVYDDASLGGAMVDPKPLIDDIMRAKRQTFDTVVDDSAQGGVRTIVKDERAYKNLTKVEDLVRQYGDSMTIDQARGLREVWDGVVAKTAGGFSNPSIDDATEAGVARLARESMRKRLNAAAPDVESLNAEYTFWARLRDIARATNERKVGQVPGGLTRNMSRGAGLVAGAAGGASTGDPVTAGLGALAGGVVMDSLNRLLASSQYRLLSASVKQRLADALSSGNQAWIKREVGRAAAAINALSAGNGSVQK
jgi:hypothetical protein